MYINININYKIHKNTFTDDELKLIENNGIPLSDTDSEHDVPQIFLNLNRVFKGLN